MDYFVEACCSLSHRDERAFIRMVNVLPSWARSTEPEYEAPKKQALSVYMLDASIRSTMRGRLLQSQTKGSCTASRSRRMVDRRERRRRTRAGTEEGPARPGGTADTTRRWQG